MDTYTTEHLDRWLEEWVLEDQRPALRQALLALIQEDPSLLDRSWPELARMVEGW